MMADPAAPADAHPIQLTPENVDNVAGYWVTNDLLLRFALWYASIGRPVFPCDWRPGDHAKAPMVPPPGFRLATTDPQQVCDWWIRWPDALIGSPVPGHLICLDIDPRKGGSIAALEALANEPLNETEFVMSGRGDGGVHLFYHRPEGYISSTYLRRVCPGIDIKLDTGYTILPPSPHPDSGMPYTCGNSDVGALNEAIRVVIQHQEPFIGGTGRPNQRALEGILRRVAEEKDNRNDITFWAFNRLVENNYPESAYNAVAEAAAHSGLPRAEIAKTFNSARKARA
jgi:hypothetical protein